MGGVGIGVSIDDSKWELSGGGIWTPAAVTPYSWLDPGSGLARNTQPTPDDWDMETAGVALWTAYAGANSTLSKVAGYAGSQALRIDRVNNPFGARQDAKLVSGNRYSLSVSHRGTALTAQWLPGISSASIALPASATWITTSGEKTADGINHAFLSFDVTAGAWFEVDSLAVANLSLASWTPRAGTVLTPVAQATAASMQWRTDIAGKYGVRGDGTADQSTSGAAAAAYPLHKGCLVGLTVNTDTAAAGNDYLIDTLGDDAAAVGVGIYHDATNSLIGFRVGNGSGAYVVDATAACSKNATHAAVCSYDGTDYAIYIDGVAVTTGAGVGAASAADASNALRIGARSGVAALWHQGAIGQIVLAPYSAAQSALSAWLAANPWGTP